MNKAQLADLHKEMGAWASITGTPRWDARSEPEEGALLQDGAPLVREALGAGTAKPIGLAQWKQAIAVAIILDNAVGHLPTPKPGADEAGFIWLTYEEERRNVRFALEVHSTLIKPAHVKSMGCRFDWTTRRDGFDKKHSSWSLSDVVQSLRATFPPVVH